jgi:alkylation response protein AidB-like acyl-CoA dehydrogenase
MRRRQRAPTSCPLETPAARVNTIDLTHVSRAVATVANGVTMDLEWSEQEAEFRRALRASITANLRPGWNLDDRDMPEADDIDAVKAFCAALGGDGFLTPHWPPEHGGRAASPWEQLIISEETWRVGEPRGGQYMNTNWIGPALMAYGTPDQQAQHLPPIARGEVNWCQGFSEPDAGSDLAALRTRAVRDGDSYVVNGPKVWTSYAHAAEWCFLLVRTDPESPKREGITILLVPMDSPGIQVREIANPYAHHLIHEIHFTDVIVPVSARLGDENQGWGIVRNVLANERVGIARHAHSEHVVDDTAARARQLGIDADDPGVAETVGVAYSWCEAARALNYVAVAERIRDPHGSRPLAAVSRAITGPMEREVAWACQEVLGDHALAPGSEADRQVVTGTTSMIAAGAYEVQLDLIGRLCLDLPRSR